MIKILTDTSTMYAPAQGSEKGIHIFPIAVLVKGQTYHEFVDIDSKEFYQLISDGSIPSSSQPPIGEVMEVYEKYADDDIIHICMADGLSGTYQSALSAREGMDHKDKIHVINSKTLCAPQRYLIDALIEKVNDGADLNSALAFVKEAIETSCSFLIPQDFSFLKRGGRLTPLAATVGGLLKIKPVMTQTEDGCRIEKFTVGRTMSKAVDEIIAEMKKRGVDKDYKIGISHADALDQAQKIMDRIKATFPESVIELFELTPAFITQGGPQCIAIQAIKC